jgi:hypothetical protein
LCYLFDTTTKEDIMKATNTPNAIVGHGRAVHAFKPGTDTSRHVTHDNIRCGAGWTSAGGKMVAGKVSLTEFAVTCKRCVKLAATENPAQTAERLNIPIAMVYPHSDRHECLDGRTYDSPERGGCLVTDPKMHDVAMSKLDRIRNRPQAAAAGLALRDVVRIHLGSAKGPVSVGMWVVRGIDTETVTLSNLANGSTMRHIPTGEAERLAKVPADQVDAYMKRRGIDSL